MLSSEEDRDKPEEWFKQLTGGTIVRKEWDEEWTEKVRIAEAMKRYAICGVPTKAGEPCKGVSKKEFNYYCRLHKHDGKAEDTVERTKLAPVTSGKGLVKILALEEIHSMLNKCNICLRKKVCTEFIVGHYCMIEERIYHGVIESIKNDYEIDQLDMFVAHQAAQSYINIWRARVAQASYPPSDANEARAGWVAKGESKEFRDILKTLGLTREQRMKKGREKIGATDMPTTATLAQVMSAIQNQKKVTITQTIETQPEAIEVEYVDEE